MKICDSPRLFANLLRNRVTRLNLPIIQPDLQPILPQPLRQRMDNLSVLVAVTQKNVVIKPAWALVASAEESPTAQPDPISPPTTSGTNGVQAFETERQRVYRGTRFRRVSPFLERLSARRGCEFLVGWNKHSAVPAEDMSITIRIAGTALCLFQPTASELKNSQAGSAESLWGSCSNLLSKLRQPDYTGNCLTQRREAATVYLLSPGFFASWRLCVRLTEQPQTSTAA